MNTRSLLLSILLIATISPAIAQPVLQSENYKHYIDSFNTNDEELFVQYINNKESWDFLSANIPLLDCPDKMIEQTYYFRWWTYRKHIKKTPDGFVILEFLPDVPWAGKYNTINCPAAHHIYEGRWLHDAVYMRDYAKFWLKGGGAVRTYSFWIADALYNYYMVTKDVSLLKELFPLLMENYEGWEKERLDPNGLFWQEDGRDGMEVSICGALSEGAKGYRATINSYMYADAVAISRIALLLHEKETAERFVTKSEQIKKTMLGKLWDAKASFFKVLPRGEDSLCTARELHGYTPWYFNMPGATYNIAWKYLMDPHYFYAAFGPTTAEQNHPGFKIAYEGHECQWNGRSSPFATSITLTAAANLLNNYKQPYFSKKDYYTLISNYANSHQIKREDGKTLPWIDENLNPFTGDWISRTRLKTWDKGTWSAEKGGKERGKDYNHSTYCDLIITGLIGLRPQADNSIIVNPLLPENTWDYFCLDNVLYHGKTITILYDKNGNHYKKGKGLMVFVNGQKVTRAANMKKIKVIFEK
ncbi:MAG: hypothetical protein QM802_19155 [Agriterribacter sp.]